MYDNICSLPLTADLVTQALHPSLPILSVGLASGHVQTFRLPPVDDIFLPPPKPITNGHVSSKRSAFAAFKSSALQLRSDASTPKQYSTSRSQKLYNGHSGRRLSADGYGTIDTAWHTRRHKGSCRSLAFSSDGNTLYSCGTDGLVKVAEAESGKVRSKMVIPGFEKVGSSASGPSVIHELSPQALLLGTDDGALHVWDVRTDDARLEKTMRPHDGAEGQKNDEAVTSITPLPPTEESTSGTSRQWITTAGSTLAASDLRKGKLAVSEDQGDILLASTVVRGLAVTHAERKRRKLEGGRTAGGDKAVVCGANGVLTLWERGAWLDQSARTVVEYQENGDPDGETSLDCVAVVPEAASGRKMVAVGVGNGVIKFVELGVGKNDVVGDVSHDERKIEGVTALGFDIAGRMISGGGQIVKIWHPKVKTHAEEENAEGEDADEDDEDEAAEGADADDSDESESEMEIVKPMAKKKQKGGRSVYTGDTNMAFQMD